MWEVSVGRPSERGVIQQRAHTLNPPPYQHCICNQLRFAKQCTHAPTCQRECATRAVHCWAITATWGDEFGTTAVCRSGLTRDTCTWDRRALLFDTVTASRPSPHSTSQGPPPNLKPRGVISTELQHSRIKCVVHTECRVSFEYLTSLEFWNSRIKK